ncbi:thiosulfate:glutathione sulfurtransferase-like isoform X2 [Solea solea]|uniref:thiosulfate:glutathione sulfurtransferase-like isoform X2 n=1 Tax=Solea solea TaxID=90069 RepID=UPI00272A4943|nr:thiosulfate:glutathione sulfurtransferase-like isoform X2 [Solea solea]
MANAVLKHCVVGLRLFRWQNHTRVGELAAFMNTGIAGKKEISYEDLKALLAKSQNLLLVDVRSQDEVDKGRIPGSTHIPVATVKDAFSLEPEEFKAKYGVTKPPLETSELVFHCQMGRRGAAATAEASSLGYVNACNYSGGYQEWSKKEKK